MYGFTDLREFFDSALRKNRKQIMLSTSLSEPSVKTASIQAAKLCMYLALLR
ncbi:MAG: hypothetical protein BWY75_03363 [bacterium ADurb.Bin425]|nr:MAG: hypothetical protein BWY75_03363 [bacterium ADurb.Bin425]